MPGSHFIFFPLFKTKSRLQKKHVIVIIVFIFNIIVCICVISDTLDSSYAMVLLPLACDPLEYLSGKFKTQQNDGQDRVRFTVIVQIKSV